MEFKKRSQVCLHAHNNPGPRTEVCCVKMKLHVVSVGLHNKTCPFDAFFTSNKLKHNIMIDSHRKLEPCKTCLCCIDNDIKFCFKKPNDLSITLSMLLTQETLFAWLILNNHEGSNMLRQLGFFFEFFYNVLHIRKKLLCLVFINKHKCFDIRVTKTLQLLNTTYRCFFPLK